MLVIKQGLGNSSGLREALNGRKRAEESHFYDGMDTLPCAEAGYCDQVISNGEFSHKVPASVLFFYLLLRWSELQLQYTRSHLPAWQTA